MGTNLLTLNDACMLKGALRLITRIRSSVLSLEFSLISVASVLQSFYAGVTLC
jgi:hypothetical protein